MLKHAPETKQTYFPPMLGRWNNFQPLILREAMVRGVDITRNESILQQLGGPCKMKRTSIGMRIPQVGLRLIDNSRSDGGNGIVVCCLGVVGGMVLTQNWWTTNKNNKWDVPIPQASTYSQFKLDQFPKKFGKVKEIQKKIFKISPRDLGASSPTDFTGKRGGSERCNFSHEDIFAGKKHPSHSLQN